MDDGRDLPTFDNHYTNGTLVDNWYEDREMRGQGEGRAPHTFTLSGAAPAQHEQLTKDWARSHTVYQVDYGNDDPGAGARARPLQDGTAAEMKPPPDMPREMIFGTAEHQYFEGSATNWDYGSYWAGDGTRVNHNGEVEDDKGGFASSGTAGNKGRSVLANTRREQLFRSTAAARQEAGVTTLYESNEKHKEKLRFGLSQQQSRSVRRANSKSRGANATANNNDNNGQAGGCGCGRRTFRDMAGERQEVRATEQLPDEDDRFVTTKMSADTPVDHFFFQRRLPPPTVQ